MQNEASGLVRAGSGRARRVLRRIMLGLAVVIAVPTCGGGPFAVSTDAVYVLDRVNGESLPVVLWVTQFSTMRLEADTIRFIGSGRYREIRWTRQEERGTGESTLERQEWTGVVRPVRGGFVMISDACADPRSLVLCVAPDTARAEAGGLVLRGPVPPGGVKRFDAR